MNITSYFIKHPVSAIVLNIAIVLIGILSFYSLVIREYPDVVLPKLLVETTYPNASAELVETAITNVLEDQLAGVEGIDNISSESRPNTSLIVLNFRLGTPMEKASTDVRDAISLAKDHLPEGIKEPIIRKKAKDSGPPFIAVCLESDAMNFSELTHYANLALKNSFRSLQGVSSVEVWGRPYTYKVTLDHQKMYNFGINADEVYDAIAKSGVSLPVGKFRKESPVTINTDLETTEDMENILVQNKGNPVFLKSIAKIELGSDDQKLRLKMNGKPGLCIGISRASDANPLDVSKLVHLQVSDLKQTLPESIRMEVSLDQAEFIRASISNIKSSIFEAIIFVLIIVFLFLRNVRATMIPIITIPIALVGSLLFLKFFGFSINIITLLAMVLAIGLVVDDAIVVLENITRHLEKGETPYNAAINGAKEIGFAIVAMTLTLTSVYAPIAFISGMTGQLFIEFAAALAGSVLISGVTALTLSPLMCAKLLKTKQEHLFPQVDLFLDKLAKAYSATLKTVMGYPKVILGFLGIALISIFFISNALPRETAPAEDRGLIGVFIPSTPGKSIDHTEESVNKVEAIMKNIPEAQGSFAVVFEHGGSVVLPLKPIEERKRSAEEIVNSIRPSMTSFPSLDAWPWNWNTALPGLDDPTENAELQLVVSTTDSYPKLLESLNKARDAGEEQNLFSSVHHDLRLDNLGYNIEIDKDILAKLHLTKNQVAKMVEIFFSGNSSTKFKKDGILYSITIEGDKLPWDLNELYITNSEGKKISIGSFAKLTNKAEPKSLYHYNQMRSANFKASLNMGDKLEDSMNKLYKLANDNLPFSYKKNWTGIAKTYSDSAASMPLLFLLALLFIYAILAVQFDNFIDPLIILFTVPLACSGALLVMYFTSASLNIYSQVGLITLIGLITKHGILIVEFANQLHHQGNDLLESIKQSAALRLRPILMTTGAMVAGSIPLIISSSAGSEARHAIGVVLVAGLSIGTVFTLFVLPSLYYMVKSWLLKRKLTN